MGSRNLRYLVIMLFQYKIFEGKGIWIVELCSQNLFCLCVKWIFISALYNYNCYLVSVSALYYYICHSVSISVCTFNLSGRSVDLFMSQRSVDLYDIMIHVYSKIKSHKVKIYVWILLGIMYIVCSLAGTRSLLTWHPLHGKCVCFGWWWPVVMWSDCS